jgi:hypothetical protein
MATYIGIEQNTDLKCEQTVIVRLGASRSRAEAWLGNGDQGFAFPGAARSDIPGSQQNWHHRLRNAYVMPPGYRLPKKEAEQRWESRRGSVYQGHVEDHLADLISRDADEQLSISKAVSA